MGNVKESRQNTAKALKELRLLNEFCQNGRVKSDIAIPINYIYGAVCVSALNKDHRAMEIIFDAINEIADLYETEDNKYFKRE